MARPSRNVCQQCGARKQSFATRADAKRTAKNVPGKRLRVYACGPSWHLTSILARRTVDLREGTP